MAVELETLEAEILSLPRSERSYLLDRLVASLDADPAIQEAWEVEAERRDLEVREGRVEPLPGKELIASLRTGGR